MGVKILWGGLLFVWLYRKVVKSKVWLTLRERILGRRRVSIVEFYGRMLSVLESKGFKREPHQTPLEYAYALRIPEVVRLTEKYNDVRFGEKSISTAEADDIENLLGELKLREATK